MEYISSIVIVGLFILANFAVYSYPVFLIILLVRYRQYLKWPHYLALAIAPLLWLLLPVFDKSLNDRNYEISVGSTLFLLLVLGVAIVHLLPFTIWLLLRPQKKQQTAGKIKGAKRAPKQSRTTK